MLIGESDLIVSENDPELEIIAVKIGNEVLGTFEGLGGTFASFVYCCLEKKLIPGFHDEDFIAEAELKEAGLLLVLSGRHTKTELVKIMDIALLNVGAFPRSGAEAEYVIDVKSKK
ncbi:MAG: hypothetical protein ABFD82_03545 [Syntrophaceae bacterium]